MDAGHLLAKSGATPVSDAKRFVIELQQFFKASLSIR
jgi:hypothetical protein